jgi:hypothetical protein
MKMNREEYERKLKWHDWQYEYSDDHAVWRRGTIAQRELEEAARTLDPDYALWNLYAPADKQRLP